MSCGAEGGEAPHSLREQALQTPRLDPREVEAEKEVAEFVYPADWEKAQAMWFAWPTTLYVTKETQERNLGLNGEKAEEAAQTQSLKQVIIKMIRTVAPVVERVYIVCDENNAIEIEEILDDVHNKELIEMAHPSNRMRDFGPVFLKSHRDGSKPLKGLYFCSNDDWSLEPYQPPQSSAGQPLKSSAEEFQQRRKRMVKVGKKACKTLGLGDILKTKLKTGGSAQAFNGRGTVIVVKQFERQSNRSMKVDAIEEEYKARFNVTNVIWLKKGLVENELPSKGFWEVTSTQEIDEEHESDEKQGKAQDVKPIFALPAFNPSGRIDQFCRFVNPTTIMLAEVPQEYRDPEKYPISAANHKRLEKSYRILSQAVDQEGKSFRIVRVPLPPVTIRQVYPDDDIHRFYLKVTKQSLPSSVGAKPPPTSPTEPISVMLPLSYLSFVLCNGLVLVPKFNLPTDAEVLEIFEKEFGGWEVTDIEAEKLAYGGGGFYNSVLQQPEQKHSFELQTNYARNPAASYEPAPDTPDISVTDRRALAVGITLRIPVSPAAPTHTHPSHDHPKDTNTLTIPHRTEPDLPETPEPLR